MACNLDTQFQDAAVGFRPLLIQRNIIYNLWRVEWHGGRYDVWLYMRWIYLWDEMGQQQMSSGSSRSLYRANKNKSNSGGLDYLFNVQNIIVLYKPRNAKNVEAFWILWTFFFPGLSEKKTTVMPEIAICATTEILVYFGQYKNIKRAF